MQEAEVAGVGVTVQSSGAAGAGQQEPDQEQPGAVPLLLRAVGDDLRQRGGADPAGDQDAVLDREDVRDVAVGVVPVGVGGGGLGVASIT